MFLVGDCLLTINLANETIPIQYNFNGQNFIVVHMTDIILPITQSHLRLFTLNAQWKRIEEQIEQIKLNAHLLISYY